MLWQIKMATAALNAASAEMEKSHAMKDAAAAQMEQAHATVAAATVTGKATVQAAEESAHGNVTAATITGRATVDAAQFGNAAEIASTKVLNTGLYEPLLDRFEISKRVTDIQRELQSGLDNRSHEPLNPEQLNSRREELKDLQQRLTVIRNRVVQNISGTVTTFADGIAAGFKALTGAESGAANQPMNPNIPHW
jgi:hypothetical protein